jgi:hypothetical protein
MYPFNMDKQVKCNFFYSPESGVFPNLNNLERTTRIAFLSGVNK